MIIQRIPLIVSDIYGSIDTWQSVLTNNKEEMNDGVYFNQNGSEVIVINGIEYSREEFDFLVDICGDCNM
nr:MAG: hypothetical protein [Bacteriophage sp.]